jgi:RNA polymerase sigma factor (sigma-70 family)
MRNVLTSLGDRDLVERIQRGETTAESEFVHRYGSRLRAAMFARTRNHEDAEDLAQDTLLAVLQALRRGAIASNDLLAAFVHGTARNIANNFFRARERRPPEVPLSEDMPARPIRSQLEGDERLALALDALARQRVLDREILLMSLLEGLTPLEIGRALRMRPEQVRSHKCRATHRLVTEIGGMPPHVRPMR